MAGIFWISASSVGSGAFCATAAREQTRSRSRRRMGSPRATHCTKPPALEVSDQRDAALQRSGLSQPGDEIDIVFRSRLAREQAHDDQSKSKVEDRECLLVHG